jgi:hypothetical protein
MTKIEIKINNPYIQGGELLQQLRKILKIRKQKTNMNCTLESAHLYTTEMDVMESTHPLHDDVTSLASLLTNFLALRMFTHISCLSNISNELF